MTLTTDRPRRSAAAAARRSSPAATRPTLAAHLVLPDVYRVTDGAMTVGYIQLAGRVYVGLLGCVYNTSVEVGQHLDLESALDNLAACCRGGDR